MAACCTAAFAPSFQRGASAFMPCMAAQVSSATTAITSPSFTTCRTPRTATAASAATPSAALRLAGVGGPTPAFRRGLNENQARGRPRLPQGRPALDDGQGGAGGLVSFDALGGGRVDCEAIDGGIGRGGLHRD